MKNYRQEFNSFNEKERDSKTNFAKELVEKDFQVKEQ